MDQQKWAVLLDQLKGEVSEHDFQTWFAPIKFLGSTTDSVYLGVSTPFQKIWIHDNYLQKINNDMNNIAGKVMSVKLLTSLEASETFGESAATIIDDNGSLEDELNAIEATETRAPKKQIIHLIPSYTFDRFIVGDNNEFAHAAAMKVAQNPGKAYNPLFIYGGVGLGKTHLMQAVGQKLLQKDVNLKIACLTSEEFTNLFVNSIRRKSQEKFRENFRSLDILLLDDVQFLLNKEETRNELFNTFNSLHNQKKQIILTSDRTPKQLQIDGMDDRLTSRMGWGLDVEIRPPSIETKQAILQVKAEEEHVRISEDVIGYIASVLGPDIRNLENALAKIIAEHRLLKKQINMEMARRNLKEYTDDYSPRNISVDDVIRETANAYKLSKADIKSLSRTSQINEARQVIMYLSQKYIGLSLKEIGAELRREHPTIISGIKKIKEKYKTDRKIQERIDEITENLRKK